MTTVHAPDFAGTRWAAGELTRDLPAKLEDVTVDFTATRAAGWSFCSEIVQQLAVARDARSIRVVGARLEWVEFIETALRMSDVSEKLVTP
jgi:hypothetical protein